MFCETDKLVTHLACMDGSACAVLFIAAGGKRENVIFSSPAHAHVDQIAKDLGRNHAGRIFFADISVSEETAELLSNRSDVRLFDHHKTAIPLKRFPWCTVDAENSRCGAMVFFDHILNNKTDLSYYSWLLELVDDRDRWVNSFSDSKRLSTLHGAIGQHAFVSRFLADPDPVFTSEERFLLRIEDEKRARALDRARNEIHVREDHGRRVGYVLCDGKYRSDVGNVLCSELGLDAVVLIGASSLSFRAPAHSQIDVAMVAKQYAGGGHRCAAGCEVSSVLGSSLVELVINKLKVA
jgi:oligoribonuclease NrnB/cAMP/cGMP phosphodiesterase (DHH superfamily)